MTEDAEAGPDKKKEKQGKEEGSGKETPGSNTQGSKKPSTPKKNTLIISAAGGGAAVIAIAVAILAFSPFGSGSLDQPLIGDQSGGSNGEEAPLLDIGSEKDEKVVVAEVNQEDITRKDVKQIRQTLGPQSGAQIDNKTIVDSLVERELLLQEAERRELDVTSKEAEAQLSDRLERTGQSLENFTNRVEQQGKSYDNILGQFGDQIAIQGLQKEITKEKDIQVTDKQVKQYYEKNKDKILQNFPESQRDKISYDNMKGQLKRILVQQQQQQALDELISKLKNQSDIKIYEDRL